MNWEPFALEMSVLLERIEMVADDPAQVRRLTAGRYLLAEKHGAVVEVAEPINSWMQ